MDRHAYINSAKSLHQTETNLLVQTTTPDRRVLEVTLGSMVIQISVVQNMKDTLEVIRNDPDQIMIYAGIAGQYMNKNTSTSARKLGYGVHDNNWSILNGHLSSVGRAFQHLDVVCWGNENLFFQKFQEYIMEKDLRNTKKKENEDEKMQIAVDAVAAATAAAAAAAAAADWQPEKSLIKIHRILIEEGGSFEKKLISGNQIIGNYQLYTNWAALIEKFPERLFSDGTRKSGHLYILTTGRAEVDCTTKKVIDDDSIKGWKQRMMDGRARHNFSEYTSDTSAS